MKILYLDCETTGRDPKKCDIIQLAGIVEIDGEIKEEFDLKCQPFSYDNIEVESFDVHAFTLEEITNFPQPGEAYQKFVAVLGRYVDKYDKRDKFYPAGFRVSFDLDFINEFFRKNGDVYFGSWQNWHGIDPLPVLHWMEAMGKIKLQNYKLQTVCELLGFELEAHDALSDIKATRGVVRWIRNSLKDVRLQPIEPTR